MNRGLDQRRLLKKLLLVYSLVVVIGLLTDKLLLLLCITMALNLAWHYFNMFQLYRWLDETRRITPPDSRGTWGGIFNAFYRQLKRYRQRQKDLRGVIESFRSGAEALPDAAVVLRYDFTIQWCNRKAVRLLGLRWPDDHGQHIGNLIRHPSFVEFIHTGDFSHPMELPSPLHLNKTLEFRVMPYSENQYLIVARDITQLRQLEGMRSQFVANVTHELRTPLTVLRGYLEMLDPEEPSPMMWKRAQPRMVEQAHRMNNLVNQLLTLSKIEVASEPDFTQEVDIPSMLGMVQEEAIALSGERKHAFTFDIDQNLWCLGDSTQLRSAISNLVYNAVHYTPAGGEIRVSWKKDEQGNGCFAVQDTGIGIPQESINRLTERFFRIDKARSRETGGAGLGLAIVKHALSHHGSQLRIKSEEGVGSTFLFRLKPELLKQNSYEESSLT